MKMLILLTMLISTASHANCKRVIGSSHKLCTVTVAKYVTGLSECFVEWDEHRSFSVKETKLNKKWLESQEGEILGIVEHYVEEGAEKLDFTGSAAWCSSNHQEYELLMSSDSVNLDEIIKKFLSYN